MSAGKKRVLRRKLWQATRRNMPFYKFEGRDKFLSAEKTENKLDVYQPTCRIHNEDLLRQMIHNRVIVQIVPI